jgi:hypothetical protein
LTPATDVVDVIVPLPPGDAQIVLPVNTRAVGLAFTVIVTGAEVAGLPVAHEKLDVSTHVITSLCTGT